MVYFAVLILVLLFVIYQKPYWGSAICLVLFFSGLNVELSNSFLNLRAILTFAVFLRLSAKKYNHYFFQIFRNQWYTLLLIFFSYAFFCDLLFTELTFFDVFKTFILNIFLCYIGVKTYLYNRKIVEYAIILSGFICLIDLLYTFIVFDSFPIRRISTFYLGYEKESNHNFFGMVCGLACIISWLKFIKEKEKYMRIALLGSIFAMSLGVIISTSRSAVLGLIGVFLIFSLRKNGFYKTIFVCFIMIMFTIFTYLLIDGFANGTQFQIKLKERFIEEPLTAIYSSQGKRYSQETHGSGEWREESAINGLNVFLQFPLNEKLFGIGTGGYVIRNYSEGLQPHNGYLLLFIERGLIGGLIFCALLFSLIKYYSKIKPNSINMLLIVFMLFYSLPQNSELTSGLMVLLIGSEIAERFTLTGRFN